MSVLLFHKEHWGTVRRRGWSYQILSTQHFKLAFEPGARLEVHCHCTGRARLLVERQGRAICAPIGPKYTVAAAHLVRPGYIVFPSEVCRKVGRGVRR